VKVSAQRIPDSQVVLEIEVDSDQMERSLDKAYRKLAQRVDVPGFRKGKTPRGMLERHVGRVRLLHEAHDMLIPEVYNKAIEEQDIDAIGQPATLDGGLAIPGGALDTLRTQRGVRADVRRVAKIDLPALASPPTFNAARPIGSNP